MPRDMAVDALRKFASEKDADRIIAALLSNEKTARRQQVSRSVTRLLLERLGARGRAAVEGAMDRLDPEARMFALWKLKGFVLDKAIDDLHAAGVVTIAREPLLDAVRLDQELIDERGPLDVSNPDTFVEALTKAGVLLTFDAETGMVPCDHDDLIRRFAEHSLGRFTPECMVQTWNRKREHDDNTPYTVRFLHKGRLYRFAAENKGDWYDVESIHRALNFALRTAGQKERYITLASNGQAASFVFAVPAAFLPIAEKYGLALSDDPDAAMRKGKDFEEKAINRLRE
jgi:hypothetical protein